MAKFIIGLALGAVIARAISPTPRDMRRLQRQIRQYQLAEQQRKDKLDHGLHEIRAIRREGAAQGRLKGYMA